VRAIVVHGGAGSWSDTDENAVLEGIGRAVAKGKETLRTDGTAVSAVIEAVSVLEDNPRFNAGRGACLNLEGKVEMDAAVMDGSDRSAGGVANVRSVRHPIRVARDVMDELDHVLIGGDGAVQFARRFDHVPFDPVTEQRREQYENRREALLESEGDLPSLPRLRELIREHPEWLGGTVGAAALDSTGQLAAATSTGGVFMKWPGRIGDTPLIGAGTYANEHAGVSATGHGEWITRSLFSRETARAIEQGDAPADALRSMVDEVSREMGKHVGAVALNQQGKTGVSHGAPRMPHGWWRSEEPIRGRMTEEETDRRLADGDG
jgi:beta-aspartyl-peptidase (threonine type)